MTNNILVKLAPSGNFILLTTYDRVHGRSSTFYLTKSRVFYWLEYEEEAEDVTEVDALSSFHAYRVREGYAYVRVVWATAHSGDCVSGYYQSFELPLELFQRVCEGEGVTYMVKDYPVMTQARITLSDNAQEMISLYGRKKRRALSKALRNAFCYGPDSTVTLYADFGGFFFIAEGGICGLRGGLILHEKTVTGSNGSTYTGYGFSVHT